MSDDELAGLVRDLRRTHPLQYGWRYGEVVRHTENDPDPYIVDRMNRCPVCEQWSPCDSRKAADEIERLQASNHAALAALKRVRDDAVLMADQLAGKSPLVGPLHLGIVYADDVLSPSRTTDKDPTA